MHRDMSEPAKDTKDAEKRDLPPIDPAQINIPAMSILKNNLPDMVAGRLQTNSSSSGMKE